jgi:hypothetical protein
VEGGAAGVVAADEAIEVTAGDEVHGEAPIVPVGVELVQANQVGVGHPGQRPELVLEPVGSRGRRSDQRLEGQPHLTLAIEGNEDGTEATAADLALDDEALRYAMGRRCHAGQYLMLGGPAGRLECALRCPRLTPRSMTASVASSP